MKILGLDLGSASIGWALIEQKDGSRSSIIDMGCRIIPYEGTEGSDFDKGAGESRNSIRTTMRTARKGYDRYQLRRRYLVETLVKHNIHPDEATVKLPKQELWGLRSRAVTEQISLPELGRLLLWLNQKRGYKSSRSEANMNKKDTDYVSTVKSRYEKIQAVGQTIGQYFYPYIKENEFFRVKEEVFPREAYIEEFDTIVATQKRFYPSVLTDELISKIRNEIIYYQRRLKSQKGLVAVCEFEGFWTKKGEKEYFVGPRVAPKSSPLFQVAKIWENINNIRVTDVYGKPIEITPEQKQAIFNHLNTRDKLSADQLRKILKLEKGQCHMNKQLQNGLTGNKTYSEIAKCFDKSISNAEYKQLFEFDLTINNIDGECYLYDRKTGEVLDQRERKQVSPEVEKSKYYRLWHTIYSIDNKEECSDVLMRNFAIEKSIADKLASLNFKVSGFGNKSAKAIRKILPYMMDGYGYSDAMSYAGYDHSFSVTKSDNDRRELRDKLKPLAKNSMRQPIVEKILNQMISLVNAVVERYGRPDEIRVELARELKQSKDERADADTFMRQREKDNKKIIESLKEHGLSPTRRNIIKWRLFKEISNETKKLNPICLYCGKAISLTQIIRDIEVDVDHIIPRSKIFDDSQSNKILVHRSCNSTKSDKTAYDFMSRSQVLLDEYVERVNSLYKNKIISKTKLNKLLMTEDKIPQDFIERQLRESQYIARKSREILQGICRNVWASSGSVTDFLRHLWGWDEVTMNLQFEKYSSIGMTKTITWTSELGKRQHTKEVIDGWTKRDDHRHHAIDALTVACTKQGYIQRLNTLSSKRTKDELCNEVTAAAVDFKEKLSNLEKYIILQQPFSVAEVSDAVSGILISFKSGKKSAVPGKRKVGRRGNKRVVQTGIIVPRGPLSQESVYGKIKVTEAKKSVKYLFENPELIFKPKIKALVEERLAQYGEDVAKALKSLKKEPIYLDDKQSVPLEYGTCFKEEFVIKYKIDQNFSKVDKIIDPVIKEIIQKRIARFDGKIKEALKDVATPDGNIVPWYVDEGLPRPILSVRCYTGLSSVVPVKKDGNGNDIGFVMTANNHHVAIYRDADGKLCENIVTLWHAVERKKYGLPVIIADPTAAYDKIAMRDDLPESFVAALPDPSWIFVQSLQQNEMFILGMDDELFSYAMAEQDYALFSKHLYRVQKLSSKDYYFRHHLETKTNDEYNGTKNVALSIKALKMKRVKSLSGFTAQMPHKVKIDILGNIVNE